MRRKKNKKGPYETYFKPKDFVSGTIIKTTTQPIELTRVEIKNACDWLKSNKNNGNQIPEDLAEYAKQNNRQALKDALEDKRWTDDDMIDFVRFYKNGKVGKYVALEKFKKSKLKDDE